MTADSRLISERFPRASKYDADWVLAGVSGGANPLWLAEWLCEAMDLRPGMRLLDLGCGRALSSIFLHREFGVQVWATDLWFSASENLQRIRDADVQDNVFPIHSDARSLPFAAEFFDAAISIDSFPYYGTDDLYLSYLTRFLKTGGQIAIAGAGLMREVGAAPPPHLREWWTHDLCCLHSASWWRKHWERSAILDVEVSDSLPDGWQFWLNWHKTACPENVTEISALEADRGEYLGYVRTVGRRNSQALAQPITSIPSEYKRQPLLRRENK
jgi:ubiquinone/menaquinone biosynthesis C-methylase UbiE